MIKKILTAFLFALLTINSYAKTVTVSYKHGDTPIDVYAERTIEVLKKHIPDEENRNAVIEKILEISEERKQTSTSHAHAIRVEDFTELCRLAGWNGARKEDTQKCVNFAEAFLSLSYVGYMEVCKIPQSERKHNMRCIDDFFYHQWTLADTKVTMLQASGLSKEYAKVKYNDDIECSNRPRALTGPLWTANYYVKCRSKTDLMFYEFLFDSVYEGLDVTVDRSVEEALCNIHGVGYIASSSQQEAYAGNGQKIRDYKYWPAYCDTPDPKLCSKINQSARIFALQANISNRSKEPNRCVIEAEKSQIMGRGLRTAFGVDNMSFRREGHQLSSYEGMHDQLCNYIKRKADTEITDCYCLYHVKRKYDFTGIMTETDDVLTCYANNQPIDFLFNDLNEGNKTVADGGLESFNCSVLDGEYQGKTCFTPDKELCERIAEATLRECPECQKAYFDTEKKACVLPNTTKAIQHQKNVNIALLAGGVVVNVGLTLYFGGTNWAYFVVVADSAFAGMELGGQMHIDGVADTFFTKANNCNDATCAEEILKEYFMYLARMTNDLQDGELTGADAKFAKLVEMLPEDSQFLTDLYISGCYTPEDENLDISKCDDGKWNTDQIIRAIGITGQLLTLVGAGVKAVVGAERIGKALSKTPNLEKALTKKIPGVRESIIRKLSKGGKVLRSDGKAVKALSASKPDLVKAGKWADATVLDPTFDIKVTPLELGGKKYYLKSGDTESLIQNEISRTKQAHELLKHNKIVTSVGVVEDDQTVLKAFMDAHPEITLPRTPDTQYFIMDATHVNTVEELSDAEILGYLRNKPITIEEQNTILSELQNMNNNGLIHNDIWHNFAIYRDSGGKLHMELMDFGDFTSAQKLSRSNDDVLEIKKLFSKWSDRGLVEKGAAEYKTAKGIVLNDAVSTVADATDANKIAEVNNSSSKVIGFLEEPFIGKKNMDEVIRNLEKDGFRLEAIEDPLDREFRFYKIFADNEADIEKAQQRLLETASSDIDKKARLTAVGDYYDSRQRDFWYQEYKQSTIKKLLEDPEVAKARANWDNMDEYERWKFEHQINRKIRRQIINEDALPVAYERSTGSGAAYTMQRTGREAEQTAKELDGFDKYHFNPKEETFERSIENLVHENWHYSQDIGKTSTPQWLLDFNTDNYISVYGPYYRQPLEIGARGAGKEVSVAVEKGLAEIELQKKIDAVIPELKTLGYNVNSAGNAGLKRFSVSTEDIERCLMDGGDFSEIKQKLISIEDKIKSSKIDEASDFIKTFNEDIEVAEGELRMFESFFDENPMIFIRGSRSTNVTESLRNFNLDVEEVGRAIADRQYTYDLSEHISKYRVRVNDAEEALSEMQRTGLLSDDMLSYLSHEIEIAQDNIRTLENLDDMLIQHNYIGSVGMYGPNPNSTDLYEQLQYWCRKFNIEADLDYMTAYDYQRLSGTIKSNIEDARSFARQLAVQDDVFYDLGRNINQEADMAENVIRKTDDIIFNGYNTGDPDLRTVFSGIAFY